jgi:chromosome segregation ATPase
MSTSIAFEDQVLQALREIKTDVSELKTDVSELTQSVKTIENRLDRMDERFNSMDERFNSMDERFDDLDQKTDALWTLSNQSFSAISEIRNEVNPPWKSGRAFPISSR